MHERFDIFMERERGALDVPMERREPQQISESEYPRVKRSLTELPRYAMADTIPFTRFEPDEAKMDNTPVPQELHSNAKFNRSGDIYESQSYSAP